MKICWKGRKMLLKHIKKVLNGKLSGKFIKHFHCMCTLWLTQTCPLDCKSAWSHRQESPYLMECMPIKKVSIVWVYMYSKLSMMMWLFKIVESSFDCTLIKVKTAHTFWFLRMHPLHDLNKYQFTQERLSWLPEVFSETSCIHAIKKDAKPETHIMEKFTIVSLFQKLLESHVHVAGL